MDYTNMELEKRIAKTISDFAPMLEQIPGVAIIHHIYRFNVIYMSPLGLRLLNTTLEELQNMDSEYHQKFFNEEDAKDYVPKLSAMLDRNNDNEIISFFQQVRTGEGGNWQWYFSTIKIFMRDDDGKPLLTLTVASPIDPEHHITNKVERLLDENNFLRSNSHLIAAITKREKEIIRLMARDKPSSEIAAMLHLAEDTVKTHRRNIKRKINAKSQYDIVRFVQAFDLL